ncbi:EF-hand domain-containing family member B [Onthophagus taurus]|uniref:EF-hand domain-containing family member B n=1 Tax=Onthophagus taurus TaxID=166361 RepID=UPI0039BEBE0E
MSNKGRFKDRSPIICAAGKTWESNGSVKESFEEYTTEEHVDAIKHELKTPEKPCFPYVPRRATNYRNAGIFCESRDMFCTTITRRYETLIGDLRETTYRSLWDKTVGRVRDPTGYLPNCMDPLKTTFGRPSVKDCSAKDLVNPDKGFFEVLLDSQEGHELYRKSHNDYNLNEQINRGYIRPAYNPNKRYGMRTHADPKGTGAKCCVTWFIQDQIGVARDIQADVNEKFKSKLGKGLAPNHNIDRVPKGFRFGKRSERPLYSVPELLRDKEVVLSDFRRQLLKWLEKINKLRNNLQKQKGNINLDELRRRFLYFDKEKTGWLPVDILYKICLCQHITFDQESVYNLLKYFGIMQEDNVDYNAFVKLIDVNVEFPRLRKIDDIPQRNIRFVSTYMGSGCDYLEIDNSVKPPAGVATIRMDLDHPTVPPGQSKADLDNLGDETIAETVINPNIYTNYGLNHRDFFLPRQPEYLKDLFEKVGYQFPDDTFEKLWNYGVNLDRTGLVCIDTFDKLLAATIPPPIFKKDEENVC